MKKLLLYSSILLTLALVVWWAHEPVSARIDSWMKPAGPDPVPTLTLVSRPFTLVVPARGELLGLQTTTLMTPRVRMGSLKIAQLAEEGRVVQQGETVIEFDPSPAQIALQESENQFASVGYQLEKTEETSEGQLQVLRMDETAAQEELDYAASQIRKDEEIFSRWEIQESLLSAALAEFRKGTVQEKVGLQKSLAQSDLKILQIDRQKARTEMGMAEETLSSMRITAPQTGVLIYLRRGTNLLEAGADAWPGQPLAEIASLDKFRALVQVPEKDVTGIRAGQPVRVQLQALPGVELSGKLSRVARIAKQIQREDPRKYFECEILLDVPEDLMERLKPGMQVEAEIELDRLASALILPRSSVIRKNEGWVVFVAEGGQFREQEIQIRGSDHGFYLIEGLQAGQTVCLRHPFESQKLVLPDFSAPAASASSERFEVYW